MTRRVDPWTLLAFLAIVVLLGVNFVAVRLSNRELPPFWGGGFRFVLAALILAAAALLLRLPLPRGRALLGAAIFGALAFGANFGLIYWAMVHVPAGMASLAFATIPLLTLAMAVGMGQERIRARSVVGGILSLAGIAIVFRDQLLATVPALHLAAILAAALCAAASGVAVKHFPRNHPVSTNLVGMVVGAAMLLAASRIRAEPWILPTSAATWGAVGWLVLSSAVAFVLVVWVLSRWTASASSYTAVLSPLVTVAAAAWLVGEGVSAAFAGGALAVLAGVWVAILWKPPAGNAPAAAPAGR